MFKISSLLSLYHLKAINPKPTGSAAELMEAYHEDTTARLEGSVPVSQRYFYANKTFKQHSRHVGSGQGNANDGVATLTSRNRAVQIRLGKAKLLASVDKRLNYTNLVSSTADSQVSVGSNRNSNNPLYFSQTSPRAAGLCPQLIALLKRKLKITQLTELQGALIPICLRGQSSIIHSETGTGKSFGIALAVCNKIIKNGGNPGGGLSGGFQRLHTCILVPTTELALQYEKWIRFFGGESQHYEGGGSYYKKVEKRDNLHLSASQLVQVAIEEIPVERQLHMLYSIQPHILVGTPQRINYILDQSKIIFGESLRKKIDCLVIDEADLVLSMENIERKTQRSPREQERGKRSKGLEISGANLVERLFRKEREEIPAQLIAASATIDNFTSQTLNNLVKQQNSNSPSGMGNVVRLTTSFVEHALPMSLNFYYFAAANPSVDTGSTQKSTASTSVPPLRMVLEHLLRLIAKQTENPKILVFTNNNPEAVEETVNMISALKEENRLPEWDKFLKKEKNARKTLFVQPLETFYKHSNRKKNTHERGNQEEGRTANDKYAKINTHRCALQVKGNNVVSDVSPDSFPSKTGSADNRTHTTGQQQDEEDSIALMNQERLFIAVGPYRIARGLHLHGITHVIVLLVDFDKGVTKRRSSAGESEEGEEISSLEFLHCAGRTGRMNSSGDVLVVYSPSQSRNLQKNVCTALELDFKPTKLREVISLLGSGGNQAFGSAESIEELRLENENLEEEKRRQQLQHYYESIVVDDIE